MKVVIYEYGNKNGRLAKNFCLDVFAHGYENLSRILSIAFCDISRHPSPKPATHFLVDEEYGLVFFQAKSLENLRDGWGNDELKTSAAKELVPPLDVSQITDFAWNWLQETEYPSSSENEGGAIKGWRVYNEESGIVGGCWQSVVAVKPFWIYIGK